MYNDLILYAKGWYASKGVICEDLQHIFSKHYVGVTSSSFDISNRLIRVMDELNKKLPNPLCKSYTQFFNDIYYRCQVLDLSFEDSIIKTILDYLFNLTSADFPLTPPSFSKKSYFRLGSYFKKYPQSMTYTEMNRIVKQSFH